MCPFDLSGQDTCTNVVNTSPHTQIGGYTNTNQKITRILFLGNENYQVLYLFI